MANLNSINFESPPIMFAAWPGMGNVGIMAMDYMRRGIDARLFAELDMEPFYIPEEVVVENGVARFPEIPRSFFHEQHDPNVVFFESTAQMGGKDAMSVAQTVLDVAKKLKAPRIYTAAALPRPMSYRTEPQVFAAANRGKFLRELQSYGVEPLHEGFISGLSGLLLGIAESQNIDAACILATIPSYATDLAYPKASLAIIRSLSRIADLRVDTRELESAIADSDQTFSDIEERLRNFFPVLLGEENNGSDVDTAPPETENSQPAQGHERIPEYAMARIERLFHELATKKDTRRARELKDELDKWGLYEVYEKRFLDLFRRNESEG